MTAENDSADTQKTAHHFDNFPHAFTVWLEPSSRRAVPRPALSVSGFDLTTTHTSAQMNDTKNGPQKTETKSTPDNEPAELPVSLRDWFAGQALIGILSAYGPHAKQDANGLMISKTVFKCAWRAADAMIAERKEKQ